MTEKEILEKVNRRSPFNSYNGITVTRIGPGEGEAAAELGPESMNAWGYVHGGLLFSLCDVAGGAAASGGTRGCVTLSGNIYFLRPASGKTLTASARAVKLGKNVAVVRVDVLDDGGETVSGGEFEYYYTGGEYADK